MRPALPGFCLAIALLLGSGSARASSAQPGFSSAVFETAHELEKRLLAPCCWRETLDSHESSIASGLRQEIRRRIASGESVASVEAELVRRYGLGLRAVLPEHLGAILFGFASLFGLVVLRFILLKDSAPQGVQALESLRVAKDGSFLPAERQRLENRLDDDLAEEPSGL